MKKEILDEEIAEADVDEQEEKEGAYDEGDIEQQDEEDEGDEYEGDGDDSEDEYNEIRACLPQTDNNAFLRNLQSIFKISREQESYNKKLALTWLNEHELTASTRERLAMGVEWGLLDLKSLKKALVMIEIRRRQYPRIKRKRKASKPHDIFQILSVPLAIHIFSFLGVSFQPWVQLKLVNREWHKHAHGDAWMSILQPNWWFVSIRKRKRSRALAHLRYLSVREGGSPAYFVHLEALKRMKHLRTLIVNTHSFDGLKDLANFPVLKKLCINGADFHEETKKFKHFALLSHSLQHLELTFCENVYLEPFLSSLTNLRVLSLRGCKHLHWPGSKYNKEKRNIYDIMNEKEDEKKEETSVITANISSQYTYPPNLEILNLNAVKKLTDISFISTLSNLRILQLNNCSKLSSLLPLSSSIYLRKLDLSSTILAENEYEVLSSLSNLEVLFLSYCKTMSFLAPLTKLQHLKLSCNHITDDGVKELRGLSNLETLNVSSCKKITNACLASLSSLPSLRMLRIEDSKLVTEEALKTLPSIITVIHHRKTGAFQWEDNVDSDLDGISKKQRNDADY